MKRHQIRSSNFHTVGYDARLRILEVEFKSGSVYQYFDVPQGIYEQLITAFSAGRFLNRYIAHNYRYRLVESNSYVKYPTRIEDPVPAIGIKHLYNKLVLKFHPDRPNGNEAIMKEINRLYGELNFHGLHLIALKYELL
jgi:hypothetical protein